MSTGGQAASSAQPKSATSASPETSASPKPSETKAQNGQSEKKVASITHADLPKGALGETKKGKKGVVTHHDMKDSAVFLKDEETGKKSSPRTRPPPPHFATGPAAASAQGRRAWSRTRPRGASRGFRLEGQADSDVEIQTSIRRGMIGFETTRLVKISTPYMRSGVLHDDFARAFGKPDPDLLVWRATSALMNPRLTDARLSREQRLDPQRFAREYLAEFADDVMAFLPQAWIDAAVVQGRHELPAREGLRYTLAVDPSGGGADAFTVSVVHAEGAGADLHVVQDLLKGWGARRSGQVDLEGIVAEIAQLAERYGVRTVYGDRYSRDWVAQAFERHGLRYDSDHGLDKSSAYLEAEPLFAQGRIAILDDPTQRRELVCLERRPRPGNKATVDHPNSAGAHDDYANALALAAAVASKKPGRPMFAGWGDRTKREQEKPSPPPASEPYIPGIGVVRPGSAAFYWTHENCGNQRLVDPSVEREPYCCARCQPNWTGRGVQHRGPFL